MNGKTILILGIAALILLSFSLVTAQKSAVTSERTVERIPADKIVRVTPPPASGAKDYCYLDYTDWNLMYYRSDWKLGDKVALYFDPEDCGYTQNYPFQLTDVHLMLFDFAVVGSVTVRFSVEVTCPDICDGPGIEIWKSQPYHITNFYPDEVEIWFEDTVCLDKPFFFNVEYLSDFPGLPSLMFDTQVVDTCYQWYWLGQPSWIEHYEFWPPMDPPVGWALLGISGYVADQASCGWWYFKPDTLPQAPSGMPDFDQNQRDWVAYCGPTAVANCLWWFDAVPTAGMDPADFIELLAGYFGTTSGGTYVDSIQLGLEEYFNDYGFALTETTYWMPDFYEMEDSLKKCQDIILLLGFWWYEEGTEQEFVRGDVNADGWIDALDLGALMDGPPYLCDDAADVNDDGALDNLDSAYLWDYVLYGGGPPPPPFPDCGVDPTADGLDCADFACPGGGEWYREGGHFVTMAGVNSEKKEIAISDPDRDQCVRYAWWPGRVRTADHLPWGAYDGTYHNDPQYVSHDVYISLLFPEFPSPGSDIWDLADYCYGQTFPLMNVPQRFEAYTRAAPKHYEYFHTEVEAAIMICPKSPPDTLRNHFKTWRVEPEPFTQIVFVEDQFMSDTLFLEGIEFFSNPAKKDTFEIVDSLEHLTWYRAQGRNTLLEVEYTNQFGTYINTIDSVKYLLLPTAKETYPIPDSLDHYKAYRIKDPVSFDRDLVLEDQFDIIFGALEFIVTLRPTYFLTPALKNAEQGFIRGDVNTDGWVDASDLGALMGGPPYLCDDAADVNDDGALDNLDSAYLWDYILYGGGPPPPPFPDCGVDPTADGLDCADSLSCPTGSSGWLFDSVTHYVAYEIFPQHYYGLLQVQTFDQFGGRFLQVDTSKFLLVPTEKLRAEPPPNNPPEIGQPDFLEGYVDDIVQYDITGSDPDGDVILDDASIDIQPGCGSWNIVRISGHGTSSGVWEITWDTEGCTPCDTHMVIHDLTDETGLVGYCTTWVHLSEYPWVDHKMHYPQLPDLEGWDVFALDPKTLADDWQCSETGWVTDIHFWGSWKDLDGDPYTDDFYTTMPWFRLSIHRNVPASADTPWSRPGEQVWFWEGEIPGTPFEPPAMEHWFNPNTGEVLYNDHVPYWRYDFLVEQPSGPVDSFFQYQDSIYWLNVSAVYIDTPYQWGWKSSRDHFMDDAVFTDTPPEGPWYPLFEPPRANWFDVYFGPDSIPEDQGSTNYYGNGWYRYEWWWNMWFYDNPFVPNPKHIWLEFYVDQIYPHSWATFAINWSTDLWATEGVPGRPPLPGEDETLYIGRQIFEVFPGNNTIDFWIDDYNPEWVSIDFVAQDVMINGWIWHECVQTSMDLAFVITGHPAPPNDPPEIGQPDFLEGYVDDIVSYDITGSDPNGDVILDDASIDIQPGCGSGYSITRTSGHGTSTGTWQVTWYTDGCAVCDTHMVIHDLTDEYGLTGYCTTWVHLGEWQDSLWYWKPDTTGAPSGMPDFDQNQPGWIAYCGPTAVANCLWWFNAVPTGWTPPQLIDTLARYFHTSPVWGTYVDTMQMGLEQYFQDYGFALQESTFEMPDFYEMEDSLKRCQDIILLLGFWYYDVFSEQWYREGGHFVTMAGVCSESLKIAISDPDADRAETGWPGRVRPLVHPPHPGDPLLHNNPLYVSHDMYNSILASPFPSPGNPFWEIDYPWGMKPGRFAGFNVPEKFQSVTKPAPEGEKQIFATEVEFAVMICPKPEEPRECDDNDPKECDTLYVECGNMLVPPGGGLVKVDMTIAYDETLSAFQVPLSYEGSPICCDSMPENENTQAQVFAGSIVPGTWLKVLNIDHQAKEVVVAGISMFPPTDCLMPGRGHLGTLTFLGDSCCTIELDTTVWAGNVHVGFVDCNDPSNTLFYPVCRIDTCHIDRNYPPVIGQPDFLEGYVDSVVEYEITGTDPDGDVILDDASIDIQPGCGSYNIVRTSGHGTSSGTWQITWDTDGCTPCDTHMVIHDLTDANGFTSYCTTWVHLSSPTECDHNDPNECDTLYVECGNMLVPPGGGLVKVDMTIAYDETLSAFQVPLSYEGSPECCDSMPENENTIAQVFAGSIVPGSWIKIVNIDHQNKEVVVAAVAFTPPSDCMQPGRGHLGTLTLLGDSCCTIQLDTTDYAGNHVGFVDCNDPAMTLFYPVCRIDTCHIDRNYPPEIGQPDFLEGYVDDVVTYTITGNDPDGDVIEDEASIDIQPGCGSSYHITRITGHGTSSGTWEIRWFTDGCTPCDTHMVIHDLTDANGFTSYCTTWVHLSESWPDHKMHYPQLPDPEGWDIVATMGHVGHPGIVAADDFMCTESGRITDIHLWGSWLWNEEAPIHGFFLSIHDNIPGPPYSMPGEELWSAYVTDFEVVPEGMGPQGWYDPFAPFWEHPNHDMYFRYDITDIPEPFCQDSGTIYWLNVMADIGPPGYMGFPEPPLWGWKTSRLHYEDDAVWAVWTPPVYEWLPLTDPITGETLDLSFVITGEDVLCGDVNHSGAVEAGDVVYLISYLYKNGPLPCPLSQGDVNCNGMVDAGDVVYLISYLFRSGPPPCDPDNDGIPDC